jgi:hypothetical protein
MTKISGGENLLLLALQMKHARYCGALSTQPTRRDESCGHAKLRDV